MFNNYAVNVSGSSQTSHTSNTSINTVSGTLAKNHPYSFFRRFHLESKVAKRILSENPHYAEPYYEGQNYENWKEVPVVVLQIMVVGDMEVIAEIVEVGNYNFPIEHLERENAELTEQIKSAIESEKNAREDYDYLNEYVMKLEKMVNDLENESETPSGIFIEEDNDDV